MRDVNELGAQLVAQIKGYVQRAQDELSSRIDKEFASFAQIIEGWAAKTLEIEQRIAEIPAGKDGADGKDGETGQKGDKGDTGPAGINGKDADPVDVGAIVAEVRALIPTPKDGRDGVDGKDGAPGIEGKAGEPGRDGRDALEIQILSDIDPQKSYPRGTVACFRGGLIRATRKTNAITGELEQAGWQVMVCGVSDTEISESEDLRELTIKTTHTDGRVVEKTLRSPAIIYREIWQEGTQAKRGDAFTWAGSLWIAKRDTNAKPGTNDDFRLAVKKGRDGHDAVAKS